MQKKKKYIRAAMKIFSVYLFTFLFLINVTQELNLN